MKAYHSETYKEEQAEEDYELKGEDVDYFYTIRSWYNNGCIGVVVHKKKKQNQRPHSIQN